MAGFVSGLGGLANDVSAGRHLWPGHSLNVEACDGSLSHARHGFDAVALNTASPAGARLTIKNTSANAADLGGSGVTAANGFDLAAGATVTVEVKPGDVLFAIRSGGTDATLAIVRT